MQNGQFRYSPSNVGLKEYSYSGTPVIASAEIDEKKDQNIATDYETITQTNLR